jgi:DNA polymerase/3'-5' exonuclease PolX
MKKLIPVNQYAVENLGQKPEYLLEEVEPIANDVLKQLQPHCHDSKIVGSVRRCKNLVHDIDIVVIAKDFKINLEAVMHGQGEGIASVVNQWEMISGEMIPNQIKQTRRILPWGINLDLWLASETNFGFMVAIKTGPQEYSHQALAKQWYWKGYRGRDGYLTKGGKPVSVPTEEELYRLIGLPWKDPRYRG